MCNVLEVFCFVTLDIDHRRHDFPRRYLHECVVNDKVNYFKYRQGTSPEQQSEVAAEITYRTRRIIQLIVNAND